jgi:glycosyltransferase involved in cell wall biosynthesis
MAVACAAVSTDVRGVRDVIPTPDVGLVAPSGDTASLARHVGDLLGNPVRRRAMGDSGRRLVMARYVIDRLVADIRALYG